MVWWMLTDPAARTRILLGERTYNLVVLRSPDDTFTAYVAHLPLNPG